MKHSTQLAGFAVLIALGTVSLWAAPPAAHGRSASDASVAGVVSDSAGVPQIGAQVQLLRSDLSVAASVYTNNEGRFIITSVLPGRYALKAIDNSFLPSLRENVRLRGGATVVNLTLNTLYEVIQWLPSQPRTGAAADDDWAWTLRSAANRPLLRWLEDGPLVVVRDGNGAAPRLKARLMATGQEGTFGEDGERFSGAVEDTPESSRELLARVDFAAGSDAGMESMLGFRQDLGYAGSVQSVAEMTIDPELEGAGDTGLAEAAVRNWETIHLGDSVEIDAGSTEAMGRLTGQSPETVARALPYATVAVRAGENSLITYRMATLATGIAGAASLQGAQDGDGAAAQPRFSVRDGGLVLEHGMHQEIGWSRQTSNSSMAVRLYAENTENPILEAYSAASPAAARALATQALFDPESGLLHAAGPSYSSAGIEASAEHSLPGGAEVGVSYAEGNALAMPALPQLALDQFIAAAHPRRVQAYAISLSGTLEGSKTRWSASYRWQPGDTITELTPYAVDAMAPYLNLHICQSIRQSRDGVAGVDALVEVENLLAEGYHPYLLGDGSVLVFAQDQRSLRAGLAFTF